MNEEIKARWVEALRSGKYIQGRTVLRNSHNQYCCLGVLCNIVDSSQWSRKEDWFDKYTYGQEEKTGSLPLDIIHKSELPFRVNPSSEGCRDTQVYLACMNDLDNKSFVEIADFIEANL